jgi:hypothetical protein
MNWRTVLVGFTGGALLSAILEYPLHLYLPSGWVEGWSSASVWLALLLVLAAILLLVACGALAARLGSAGNPRRAAAIGAMAGLIAALAAEAWIGSAAAGVWGSRAMLSHGWHPAQDNSQFLRLLLDGTVETMWWVFLSVWITLIAGLGFGALGGVLAGRGSSTAGFNARILVPVVLLGMLVSSAALILTLLTFSILGPTVANVAATAGFVLAYPDSILRYFPAASGFLLMIAWQFIGLLIVRRYPMETASDHTMHAFAAWTYGCVPVAAAILCLLFLGLNFFIVPLIAGVLLSLLVGTLTLLQGWSYRATPQPLVAADTPGIRFYASVAALGTCVVLLCGNLGVVAYSLSVSNLDIRMITTLLPQTGNSSSQLPAVTVNSMSSLVDSNYTLNRTALLYILVSAVVLALLTAGAVWLVQYRVQHQEPVTAKAWIVRGLICFLVTIALLFLTLFGVFVLPVYRLATLGGF